MRKLIAMIFIAAMLGSIVGAANYEIARATGVTKDKDTGVRVQMGDFILTTEKDFYNHPDDNEDYEDAWWIVEYLGNSSKVVVPDEYQGKKIKGIGCGTFSEHTELEEIQLPKSMKNILSDTFCGCTNLKTVEIPQGVETIEFSAFEGCSNLKEIEIPESVEDIYNDAFKNCINLKTLHLPKAFRTIYDDAFEGSGIENFTIDSDNSKFTTIDGVLYNKAGTKLMKCPPQKSKVKLPDTVKEIDDLAFCSCRSLKEVEFSKALEEIGAYAFLNCRALEKVKLPDTVKKLKEGTFSGCRALKEVEFSKTLEEIGVYAFENCTALEKVQLPDTVKKLKEWAFRGCRALKEVKFSRTLEGIGKGAFENCKKLKEIVIPASVKKLCDDTFDGCDNIKTFKIDSKNPKYSASNGDLYNKKKTILYAAIANKNVCTIPASVKTVEDYFLNYGGNKIKEIKVAKGNKYYCAYDGALYDKNKKTLYFCPQSKTSIILPSTLKDIRGREYTETRDDIEYYEEYYPLCSEKLKKIQVEAANKKYSSYKGALYNKKRTKLLFVPEGIVNIVIPKTLTSGIEKTFSDSEKLKKIQVEAAHKKYSSYKGALYNKKRTKLLFVPKGMVNVVIPKTLTSGIEEVFIYGFRTIKVEKGNKKFGAKDNILYNADFTEVLFAGANHETITLPETVKKIQDDAFSKCSKLKEITFSENLEYVGWDAFSDCTSLSYVKFPDRKVFIRPSAFYGCSNLKWVYLPKDVEFDDIGVKHIFVLCNNLSDIYYAGTEEQWKKSWLVGEEEGSVRHPDYYESYWADINATKFSNLTIHYGAKAP